MRNCSDDDQPKNQKRGAREDAATPCPLRDQPRAVDRQRIGVKPHAVVILGSLAQEYEVKAAIWLREKLNCEVVRVFARQCADHSAGLSRQLCQRGFRLLERTDQVATL